MGNISKKGGNAPRAMDLDYGTETNPPQASVLHMRTQHLLYRIDNRFAARVCYVVVGELYLGLIHSRFLCDISFFLCTQ